MLSFILNNYITEIGTKYKLKHYFTKIVRKQLNQIKTKWVVFNCDRSNYGTCYNLFFFYMKQFSNFLCLQVQFWKYFSVLVNFIAFNFDPTDLRITAKFMILGKAKFTQRFTKKNFSSYVKVGNILISFN